MTLAADPVVVASVGIGWWSDVLADAIMRSGKLRIAACYSRSDAKRNAFAAKYGCRAAASFEAILRDDTVEAIINTTPNNVHRETTVAAARAGKHIFLDKPIANTIGDARAITAACRAAGVVLAVGYQRRRESQFRWIRERIEAGKFGKLVNAEANISRDRLGQIDLSSWRYTAEGMPGGVMLQIGVHYIDVLEYLLGPVKAVSAMLAQLVLPGENPDVASIVLEHENGALSTVNASYASASECYVMNIYGKEASAYYDLHQGLRFLERGATNSEPIAVPKVDVLVDELEEFARAVRGTGQPEMGGERATASLAVIRAGISSAREAGAWRWRKQLPRRMHEAADHVLLRDRVSVSTAAQEPPFPQKGTVEMTVLFPAGSSADVTVRLLADGMSKHLPGNVIVMNRPGAGGAIGYKHVATQKPDGYSLVWNSNSISTTYYSGQLPFDYRAFDPVARVLVESPVLAVRGDATWKSLAEFMADAKARPGKISVGNSGIGSHTHISSVALFKASGVAITEVPYGATQVVPSLLGGHIDAAVQLPGALSTHAKEGTVRLLAALIPQRDPALPEVPTAREQGVNVSVEAWRGVAVPHGTPAPIIVALETAIRRTVETPDFERGCEKLGIRPAFLPAAEFGALIAKEDGELSMLMQQIGLKKQP